LHAFTGERGSGTKVVADFLAYFREKVGNDFCSEVLMFSAKLSQRSCTR